MTENPRVAVYRRAARKPEAKSPQQWAAAAWDIADRAGYEIVSIDGAELGRDPRELLGD